MKHNEANKSGQNSEAIADCVLSILRRKGYLVSAQYNFNIQELRKIPLASDKLRVDFLIRGISGYETGLIIEIKRQNSPGSMDQKLPYQIEKEILEYYPYPSILILIGKHWSGKWKVYAINHKGDWLIDVFFSYESLILWCEKLPDAIPSHDIYKAVPNSSQLSLFDTIS